MPEFVKESHSPPPTSAVSDDPGWAHKTAQEPPLSFASKDGEAVVGEIAAAGEIIVTPSSEDTPPPGDDVTDAEKSGDKSVIKDQTPSWVKALISKTKNEANQARREAELSRAELTKALEAIKTLAPQQQSSVQNGPVEPQESTYDDPAEYRAAWAKYAKELSEQSARKALTEFQAQQEAAIQQAHAAKAQAELDAFLEKGRTKYDDFSDLCEVDSFPCSPAMLSSAQRMDNGEDVIHFLGTNTKEARRIYQLDPVSQVREMTRIESRLLAEAEKAKAPPSTPARQTTKPPAPIKPLASGTTASKDWEYYATKATPEEYIKWVRDGRPMA